MPNERQERARGVQLRVGAPRLDQRRAPAVGAREPCPERGLCVGAADGRCEATKQPARPERHGGVG
eukprot:2148509-Pleurochrysis_carterae.AAC.4